MVPRRDVAPDAFEPDDAVGPPSLDGRLALELQTWLSEERDRGFDVVDHEEDVVHPQHRHAFPFSPARENVTCVTPLGDDAISIR
jgi:hypothetical protein